MEDGIDVLLEDVTDLNAEVKAGVPSAGARSGVLLFGPWDQG